MMKAGRVFAGVRPGCAWAGRCRIWRERPDRPVGGAGGLTAAVLAFALVIGIAAAPAPTHAGNEPALDVSLFGVSGDGRSDAASGLQRAIDEAAGRTIVIPAGTYRFDAPVYLRSNVHLRFDRDAVLIRGWDGGSGWAGAMFGNASYDTKVNDVVIEGGRFRGDGRHGRVINWYGDRWTVRNIRIEGWGAAGVTARALSWVGDDTTIVGNQIAGSPPLIGFGGIIMAGGHRALIENNTVEAGDDGIACFPSAYGGILPDQNLSGLRAYNNTIRSYAGRAFACGLHRPDLKALVSDIVVRDFTGTAGSPLVVAVFNNSTSGGIVRDITLDNVTARAEGDLPKAGLKIAGTGSSGPISNVRVRGARITGGQLAALQIDGVGAGVSIEASSFDGSSSENALRISRFGDGLRIRDSEFIGGGAQAVVVGGRGSQISQMELRGNTVRLRPDTQVGIQLGGVRNSVIVGNRFVTAGTPAQGAAESRTFRTVLEGAESGGNTINDNVVSSN